jgi:Leucine-rich repeat (LRR) protein
MMCDLRVLLFGAVLMVVGCTPTEEPVDDGDSDTATGSDIDPDQQINFPDPVLRACVEKLTGKGSGDPIYAKDVVAIDNFECDENVGDLTGMEYLVNLEVAVFHNATFSSLQPISQLTKIFNLQVSKSGVKTLSEIKLLTNLTDLSFEISEVEDISALSSMGKLTYFKISNSKLKNLAALASLTNIKGINVQDNPTLTTLGAQFTAPKLTELNVGNCGLTSLNELNGLPELTTIDADDNYITDTSFIATLSKLSSLSLMGNCLEGDQLQTYVDWWNEVHPNFPTTYDQELSKQSSSKCQ